jgi:hypothetical protein
MAVRTWLRCVRYLSLKTGHSTMPQTEGVSHNEIDTINELNQLEDCQPRRFQMRSKSVVDSIRRIEEARR